MNELNTPQGSNGGGMQEEEEVRRLLESAGPRAEVPPEDLAAIKSAFRAEWREHVRQRQARRFSGLPRRWLLAAAAAAAILVAASIVSELRRPAPPGPLLPIAGVESVSGLVTVRTPLEGGGRPVQPTAGMEVVSGAELQTARAEAEAPGYAALRLADGSSLRLDAGSQVHLARAGPWFLVDLDRGAVYLDSAGEQTLLVRTRLGIVRDIGTQFEVRLLEAGSALRVRVREGTVRLDGGGSEYPATAGVELTLHADGTVTRQEVAGHGSPWSWVLAAAPPLEIEGKTLQEVLDQVARETGWTIRYADEELAATAGSTVVHGTIGHLTPDQALDVVLPGAGLRYKVVEGVVVIRGGEDG